MRPIQRGKGPPFKAFILWSALGGGILSVASALAQDLAIPDVVYPSLPKRAASADGFVPAGWVLEARASGDLNQDGTGDLAFVIRQNDPANILSGIEGLGEDPFDTNPRILAVAFRNAPMGDYALQLENHTLIPRRTDPVADDPFDKDDGIVITRGGMQVRLRWFLSAGGWGTFTAAYTFRNRNGRFELIGYDREDLHRGSGETKAVSANYLTRRMKVTTGSIEHDANKVTWKSLPQRPLLTLDQIGDGLAFDLAN
jgi:hypothetical protein